MPYKIATTMQYEFALARDKGCAMPYKLQPRQARDKGCAMPFKLQRQVQVVWVAKAVQCLRNCNLLRFVSFPAKRQRLCNAFQNCNY